jgi:hypothetical protein
MVPAGAPRRDTRARHMEPGRRRRDPADRGPHRPSLARRRPVRPDELDHALRLLQLAEGRARVSVRPQEGGSLTGVYQPPCDLSPREKLSKGGLLSTWNSDTFEHTFSTGRAATLRRVVNLYTIARNSTLGPALLGHLDAAAVGELRDPVAGLAVMEAIVATVWVEPEVMAPGDEREPVEDERIRFSDLYTEEVNETVELWQTSVEDAARFRDGSNGDGGGEDRARVGKAAKPGARASARKRGGVPR